MFRNHWYTLSTAPTSERINKNNIVSYFSLLNSVTSTDNYNDDFNFQLPCT
jgi:hypothetical protein